MHRISGTTQTQITETNLNSLVPFYQRQMNTAQQVALRVLNTGSKELIMTSPANWMNRTSGLQEKRPSPTSTTHLINSGIYGCSLMKMNTAAIATLITRMPALCLQ